MKPYFQISYWNDKPYLMLPLSSDESIFDMKFPNPFLAEQIAMLEKADTRDKVALFCASALNGLCAKDGLKLSSIKLAELSMQIGLATYLAYEAGLAEKEIDQKKGVNLQSKNK
jgi:hypothetical protein